MSEAPGGTAVAGNRLLRAARALSGRRLSRCSPCEWNLLRSCSARPVQLSEAALTVQFSIEAGQSAGLFLTPPLMMLKGGTWTGVFLDGNAARKKQTKTKQKRRRRKCRAEMQSGTQMATFQPSELRLWVREGTVGVRTP